MIGTAPVFYQIPVTQELLSSITPPVENRAEFLQKGMIPLDNRRIILQCFAALRIFL